MTDTPPLPPPPPPPPPARTAWGAAAFFGLVFVGAGLLVGTLGGRMWVRYLRSADWVTVPAQIESLRLDCHRSHSSKGGSSVTYRVICSYRYRWQGQTYWGDGVGPEGASGSSDAYHHRRYAQLQDYQRRQAPFPARVNPAAPQEALLFRERTTTMYILPILGLLFTGAGVGAAVMLLGGPWRARRFSARLAQHADRPWRADPRWQGFVLTDGSRGKIAGLTLLALFTGLFVSFFVVIMAQDPNAPLFVRVMVGGFMLIPLGAGASALYHLLRRVKYGAPRLVLPQQPWVAGAENTALLLSRRRLEATAGIRLQLTCERRQWERRGSKQTLVTHTLYTDTQTVAQDLGDRRTWAGSAIPVRFTLPADQPDTQRLAMPSFHWKLTAAAATPGIDFGAEFELPVYHVADPAQIERNPAAPG